MDHEIHPPIVAKYIRINPTSWKNDICLRVEYYGCDGKIFSLRTLGRKNLGLILYINKLNFAL